MAENGQAGGVYRDRRGENPFRAQSMDEQRAKHRLVQRPVESYNGQGSRGYNGSKGYALNGMTISRKSPDEQKRYQTELQLGIRREGEV